MSEATFNTIAGLNLFFITPVLVFLAVRFSKQLKVTMKENEKLKIELTKLKAKYKK
jgi:hypothetical protein